MRGLRWTLAVGVSAACVGGTLFGCAFAWNDTPISGVAVADDGRTLTVGYHCDHDASVTAEELPDEVRLTFRTYDSSVGDCADIEYVTLDAPLAERRLVDAMTGEPIEPCRDGEPDSLFDCR